MMTIQWPRPVFRLLAPVLAALAGLVCVPSLPAEDAIHFARDIRPVLAEACFRCHGVDAAQRKAKLRLDQREGLLAVREGRRVIVPGDPDQSELLRRITHDDPEERMPPVDAVRQLTQDEIARIRQWIEEGAPWAKHWAFVAPVRPDLPIVEKTEWPIQGLDHFILARLEKEGLPPSRPADPTRLFRRVTLQLTGLPPIPEEIDSFLADQRPDAYERAVDRLLASSRYGEHMASSWLDLSRFADTDGYQDDEPRVMWRWRDWLIDALNQNMPFDQFTIQQLAGDLLPGGTAEQRLATGFLRNNRVNGEGGAIPEEFRVEYIVDRVETVSSVWMGLTLGCARCHDHKYDPISQKDFYAFFAFFNQSPEPGTYRRKAKPLLRVPAGIRYQDMKVLEKEMARVEKDSDHYKELNQARQELLKGSPETMVMGDGESRETFILRRGQYQLRGDKVTADVPASLGAIPGKAPRNRLGLARWLVDPEHPLTARVAVNRLWQHHFGRGLVETVEDFGIQGALPSHPALLDWLATEFVRLGWDIKAFQRLLVTSATYRQSTEGSPASLRHDPGNVLLSRAPRGRLSAEVIRDQALFVSGLLVDRIGGASVKPYQPAKLWLEVTGVTTDAYKDGYVQDLGASLYRRSLYTFWRRAIPPPTLEIFDAPTREVCTARRERTSTPLQALALMNDVTYVESSRALASRMLLEGGDHASDRLAFGFRLLTGRPPGRQEEAVLMRGLVRHLDRYEGEPERAKALIQVGDSQPDPTLPVVELAAYTALASTLLNLGETINLP